MPVGAEPRVEVEARRWPPPRPCPNRAGLRITFPHGLGQDCSSSRRLDDAPQPPSDSRAGARRTPPRRPPWVQDRSEQQRLTSRRNPASRTCGPHGGSRHLSRSARHPCRRTAHLSPAAVQAVELQHMIEAVRPAEVQARGRHQPRCLSKKCVQLNALWTY